MKTFRKQVGGGEWVEYRVSVGVTTWRLESRVLSPNGQPYSPEWYSCTDRHLTDFQRHHPGVIENMMSGQ